MSAQPVGAVLRQALLSPISTFPVALLALLEVNALGADELAQIRAAIESRAKSVVTLESEFSRTTRFVRSKSNRPAAAPKALARHLHASAGRWHLWREDRTGQLIDVFDGSKSWAPVVHESGAQNALTISVGARRLHEWRPDNLFFGTIDFTPQPLVELLSLDQARIVGREKAGGVECIRVGVPAAPGSDDLGRPGGIPWLVSACFEPHEQYRLRRLRLKLDEESTEYRNAASQNSLLQGASWDLLGLEFAEVPDSRGEGTFSFPMEVEVEPPFERTRLLVKGVRMNHEIGDEQFRLNIPEGTVVTDDSSTPPRSYVF